MLLRTLFSRGSFFVLKFLFIVLGLLGCWSCQACDIFFSEWSFCFQGNSFDPSSIQPGVFHLFHRMAYWGAKISFLEQMDCSLSLCFLLSFLLSSAFFTIVAYWKKREEQERISAVGKKGQEIETAHYALMLMNTLVLPLLNVYKTPLHRTYLRRSNFTVADPVMDFSDSGSRSLLPSELYHQVGKTRLLVYYRMTAIDRLSAMYR